MLSGCGRSWRVAVEPALGVDRGHAAARGGRDRLPVDGVLDVTAGEHAGRRWSRYRRSGCSRPDRGRADRRTMRCWGVPDGHEDRGGRGTSTGSGHGVPQLDGLDDAVAEDLLHLGVPADGDLRVVEDRLAMIREARNSSRRWTTVTFEAMRARKSASSIAVSPPPTTTSSRSRKKNPSQVGAGAHAEPPQPRLALEAEPARGCTGRDDQRVGAQLVAVGPHAERTGGQVDAGDVGGDQLTAEPLGLTAEHLHQFGPLDTFGEARVVLDLGRVMSWPPAP